MPCLATTPADERAAVTAGQVHRRRANFENISADLKASALAHLTSGIFNANAAWPVGAVMAFNLPRTGATLSKTPTLTRARTATIHRKLIAVPARIAAAARNQTPRTNQ